MTRMKLHPKPNASRRQFLQGAAALGAAAALPRLAFSRQGSSAPEQKEVRLGFVAVESCAAIVIGHEKRIFAKHGITTTLSKENGWAAARDKLVSGENIGSHLKYAQPVGAAVGVSGSPKTALVAPFTLSRNGSIFMVERSLGSRISFDPKSWKTVADELKQKGEAFTIALPLPFGWHGMMYRHFLANGGIHADRDLKLITLPPAQMIQNMKVGTMQACCLVEPWGARGVGDQITVIAMYGHEMWPHHPVKSFGFTQAFADANPRTVRALLRGLHEAAVWCDDPKNHEELARILATPSYINTPEKYILPTLRGEFDWGTGRTEKRPEMAISFSRNTWPDEQQASWFLANFRRWGMIEGAPDYAGVSKSVSRSDIYAEAMKEAGVKPEMPSGAPIRLWDGTVFEAAKAEEYAKSFAIHSLKG
jgi:nitrate/nitrite transport system substrate-binding protein